VFGSSSQAVSYTGSIVFDLNSKIEPASRLSRADEIRATAEKKAIQAEEYDEYIQLQTDLAEYYKALSKLK